LRSGAMKTWECVTVAVLSGEDLTRTLHVLITASSRINVGPLLTRGNNNFRSRFF
jgi:hypothetical protein